jgi:hypothetical protein
VEWGARVGRLGGDCQDRSAGVGWSSWSVQFSMYMHGVQWSGVSQDSIEWFVGVVEHDSNSTQSVLCWSVGCDSVPS